VIGDPRRVHDLVSAGLGDEAASLRRNVSGEPRTEQDIGFSPIACGGERRGDDRFS
jgi:hypothetical protein